jgi:hypothetical protein
MNMGWPMDTTFYKLLTDWGSFIGGAFALIAGGAAYIGARQAATKQIRAMTSKDRLQARGIAVAIYPDIINLEIAVKNAQVRLSAFIEQYAGQLVGQNVSDDLQSISGLFLPQAIDRNYDMLFLLGDKAGVSCLTLVSMLYEHFAFVNETAASIALLHADEWPRLAHQLEHRVTLFDNVIAQCKRELEPIRDRKT